jgi:hypothetical protein
MSYPAHHLGFLFFLLTSINLASERPGSSEYYLEQYLWFHIPREMSMTNSKTRFLGNFSYKKGTVIKGSTLTLTE